LDISVVICAYTEQRWGDLVAAVLSVKRQTFHAREIIVVIDHEDTLLMRARSELSGVRVEKKCRERGLPGARNTGLAVAQGEVVAFLDDDAIADPNWLKKLGEQCRDLRVLGVGGFVEPIWLHSKPNWFPDEFNWVVGCSYRGLPQTTAPLRNLIGANMSFRRTVFEVIGGFRIGRIGTLSIGQEGDETELCIRAIKHWPDGLIIYHPLAAVSHKVPASRCSFSYFAKRGFSRTVVQQAAINPNRLMHFAPVQRVLIGCLP
jgi:glycosyltransferase involved in cell wall biosynthesis